MFVLGYEVTHTRKASARSSSASMYTSSASMYTSSVEPPSPATSPLVFFRPPTPASAGPADVIRIFDLDGTLTLNLDGNPTDLWREVTSHFMGEENRGKFVEIQQEWKQYMKAAETPTCPLDSLPTKYFNPEHLHSAEHPRAAYSAQMMQHGLNLMNKDVSEEAVREFVRTLTAKYVEDDIVYSTSIEYLSKSVEKGDICVISTGGYETGAHGFLDGLVDAGLLTLEIRGKIQVSGSKMDWPNKKAVHANVEENKITGLEDTLDLKRKQITDQLTSIHVDSPQGGDKGLVKLAVEAKHKADVHILATNKNGAFHQCCQTWEKRLNEDIPCLAFKPIRSEPIPIAGSKAAPQNPKARRASFFHPTSDLERAMQVEEKREALLRLGRPRSNSTPSPSSPPLPSL
jgi:hypothetical protein